MSLSAPIRGASSARAPARPSSPASRDATRHLNSVLQGRRRPFLECVVCVNFERRQHVH